MRSQRKPRRVYRYRQGRYALLRRGLIILGAVALALGLWQAGRSILPSGGKVVGTAATDRRGDQADAPLDPLGTPIPRPYPLGARGYLNEQLQQLRRQNEDAVGWLTIGDLLSEAVVQRDNTYYLQRDAQGRRNEIGALFLDESCDLRTRPYTLMIYGHSAMSGAMFSCLSRYEDIDFYQRNPFLSFDTVHEAGRYVIFSVTTPAPDEQTAEYASYRRLETSTNLARATTLGGLCDRSLFTCPVDVQVDDQILLLLTCVGDGDAPCVVAARRVREGESEEELLQRVQRSRMR